MNEQLRFIADASLDQAVGGAIETYCESEPVTDEAAALFERFLCSPLTENRSAALEALVVYGGRPGYEADAVLLHYQSRARGSAEEFAAFEYLRRLRAQGSASAVRALHLLESDPYVRTLWGDEDESTAAKA